MLTTYYANKVLDHINGVAALTAEAHLHVGLSTTTPTVTGGNITEPSGNGYARKQIANDTNFWNAAASRQATSKAAVTFDAASGSWGTVTYGVIWDAAEANVIAFGLLSQSALISTTDQFSIPVAELIQSIASS